MESAKKIVELSNVELMVACSTVPLLNLGVVPIKSYSSSKSDFSNLFESVKIHVLVTFLGFLNRVSNFSY